jgi:EAL domain-containing protein (putative c-di-GMP-specific phosphodiesterase class I)
LIREVGQIILKKVANDAANWPSLTIAINLSPIQLLDGGFAKLANQVMQDSGIDPQRIAFELTEGVLIDSPGFALKQLNELKEMGFGLHLDDFGAGFSSIGYLKQFPFDVVKIDRTITQSNFGSEQGDASLTAIIALGRSMNLEVYAEGVETSAQADYLAAKGCTAIQGWSVSRPVPATGLQAVINQFEVKRDSWQLALTAQIMRDNLYADENGNKPKSGMHQLAS